MREIQKVNIKPKVTILSVLKHLEYETWFALAEFVDNSIVSYQLNEAELKKIEGDCFKLEVHIEINEAEKSITVRDNAAGINETDYPRAFRAAEIPTDNSSLSEFGMGMKSAACWFSDNWSVTSTALNESIKRKVVFDINKIFHDELEELTVETTKIEKNEHCTVIELLNVNKLPKTSNLAKVKNHLTSIYRDFLRKGTLILKINNEILHYNEPKILLSPQYNDVKGKPVLWKKDIDFPIEKGLSVHGFVAIREKASTSEAGFALFRRGRVIKGSFDDGFKPDFIFGQPNSFRSQRIFGELHLEGFDVSFTKKEIRWDENLDIFLHLLRDDISSKSFPLLQQADNYRARASDKDYQKKSKVLDSAVIELQKKAFDAINEVRESPISDAPVIPLRTIDKTHQRIFEFDFKNILWKISMELSYDQSISNLFEVGDHLLKNIDEKKSVHNIGIRLSLIHPFMIKYVGTDDSKIEPMLLIFALIGLSEKLARGSGVPQAGAVRINLNKVISNIYK